MSQLNYSSNGAPTSTAVRQTPAAAILVAWLIVAVPTAWGVWQTLVKSLALFHSQPAASLQSGPASR